MACLFIGQGISVGLRQQLDRFRLAVEGTILEHMLFASLFEAMNIFPCLSTSCEGEPFGTDADDWAILLVKFRVISAL